MLENCPSNDSEQETQSLTKQQLRQAPSIQAQTILDGQSLVLKAQPVSQVVNPVDQQIIEEVTETMESISLSEISRQRDDEIRKVFKLPGVSKSGPSPKNSQTEDKKQSVDAKPTPGVSKKQAHDLKTTTERRNSSTAPVTVERDSAKKPSQLNSHNSNAARKQFFKRRVKTVESNDGSSASAISINSRMTTHERNRIQEANILRREKRKVAETRKETQKLKVFTGGDRMMQMLAKAIKRRISLLLPQGPGLQRS